MAFVNGMIRFTADSLMRKYDIWEVTLSVKGEAAAFRAEMQLNEHTNR